MIFLKEKTDIENSGEEFTMAATNKLARVTSMIYCDGE